MQIQVTKCDVCGSLYEGKVELRLVNDLILSHASKVKRWSGEICSKECYIKACAQLWNQLNQDENPKEAPSSWSEAEEAAKHLPKNVWTY